MMTERLDLIVRAGRVVVVEQHATDAATAPELDAVLGRSMSPRRLRRQLVARVLSVVDEHVDSFGELEGSVVQLTDSCGSSTELMRRVVGEIRDRRAPIAD